MVARCAVSSSVSIVACAIGNQADDSARKGMSLRRGAL
jgi:hypothetical protein